MKGRKERMQPPSISFILKNDVFVWIQIASVNMITRSIVNKTVILIDDLTLVLKNRHIQSRLLLSD